ncbi:MAG: hypothetical protein CBD21_00880 [bacterium TMED161]|nr:hypothetical protein [Candidatus Neomarinimicrobiota bacterium]OUW21491.1 MAG: hypothetical protein CBD21_00880 [bacterium TMED161]|tara:strand:- start:25985 stop:26971 length:987 start_codon:yes stop_codon:yes gene_type:complete
MNKDNVGIIEVYRIYKDYAKQIFYITFSIFTLSIIYSLVATPLYKSYVSIYPTNNDSNLPSSFAGLDGIASTFGFNLSGSDASTFNFPDIVNSRRLKKEIILKKWDSDLYENTVDLVTYWKLDKPSFISNIFSLDPTPEDHLQNLAIDHLSTLMTVYEHESGMITISLLMEDPAIAAKIVNYISDWIQIYISDEMSFKATKNRKFIEQQLLSAKVDLYESEEELSEFMKAHPLSEEGPEEFTKRARLMRNIEVNTQVYITLKQQYELNKIEELKERPVLNILDTGDVATEKSKPLRTLIVLASTFIAFFLSGFMMYCYDGIFKKEAKV